MITVERLDKIEQDLKWARDNADRSAQTRLFGHHIPFLLTILRPVAEEMDAMKAKEEFYLADEFGRNEEGAKGDGGSDDSEDTEVEDEKETVASKIQGFFSPSGEEAVEDDEIKTYRHAPESEEATEDDPFISS